MMVFLCLFLFYSSSDQIWYHLFAVAHSFPQKGTKLINSMAKHHYAAVGNLTKENCTFGSNNLNGNGWPTVNLSWFFNKSHWFPISPTIVGRTGISNIESNTEIRNRHFCLVSHRTENHCMLSNRFPQDSNNFPCDNDICRFCAFIFPLLFQFYLFKHKV